MWIYMTTGRAVMLVKRSTYFVEFGYLNSSCIRQKYYFDVFDFYERQIYAFVAKLNDRCFCWFPATVLVPNWMCTLWRFRTNLYKFEKKGFSTYLAQEKLL